MNHEEQVGKNFAWGFFSQIILRVFSFVFFVYMSHILLEKGMGQYNFVTAFVGFWFITSDFGVTSYLYREWSKSLRTIEDIKNDFNILFTIKVFTAGALFFPFCVLNWFVNHDIFLAMVLFFFFVFFSSIIGQIETYFNSVNNFKFGAIRTLLEKGVVIFVGGVALYFFRDIISVIGAMVFAQFVALLYYIRGRFPFVPSLLFDWGKMFFLIKKGIPFLFFSIFVTIYGRIDMVMLRYMQDFETVGWYGAAYKAYDITNIFSGILFLPAIFPVLSRIFNTESRQAYQDFFNRSLRILFGTSLLLSVLLVIIAPHFMGIFFPASFGPSILAMRIIVLVLIIYSLSGLFLNMIVIQHKEKISLKIIIGSALLNIILNFLLIPKYSLYGAASATVISEMFNLFLLQHFVDWDKDTKMLAKMFGMVVLSVLCFFIIKVLGYTNNIWVGLVTVFITGVSLVKLRLIQKGDIQIFYLPIKNKIKGMFYN